MLLLRKAWEAIYLISGEGSWKLTDYEKVLANAVLEALSDKTKSEVLKQLSASYFVERTSNRVSVIRFHKPESVNQIEDVEFEDSLYKIYSEVDGKKYKANVTFYKRRIFSIESSRQRKFFKGKNVLPLKVQKTSPSQSLTVAIDRSEHGSNE
jgi:hypothetical protein